MNGIAFAGTLLGPVAVVVVALLFFRKEWDALSCRFTIGFVFSLAVFSSLSCKEGAYTNYFLEASALGAIVIGRYGLGRFWKYSIRKRVVSTAILVMVCLVQLAIYAETRHLGRTIEGPEEYATVADFVGRTQGKSYLVDGVFVEAVLVSGGKIAVNDSFLFRVLEDKGLVSVSPLLDEIGRGKIAGLILNAPLETHEKWLGTPRQYWPKDLVIAMRKQFRLVKQGCGFYLYEYHGRERSGSA